MTELNTEPLKVFYQGMIGTQNKQQYRFCSDPKYAKLDLPFGVPIAVDTEKDKVVQPTATGSIIVGLTAPNFQRPNATINSVLGYKANDPVSLLEIGEIYLYSETVVNAYDPVYFRHTANGANTILGRVANATGTGLDLLKGAMFLQNTTEPGLVLVAYRMPYPAS